MAAKLEIESKLQLDRRSFELLLKRGRVTKVVEQLNIYFDYNWRLAENGSTFRVRAMAGELPTVTLKLALTSRGHERISKEIEQPFKSAFPRRSKAQAVSRQINVEKDLSLDYRSALFDLNLPTLSRVGWMRNQRHVVDFEHLGALEADFVRLPNGEEFFEVEIEMENALKRLKLVEFVFQTAPVCAPSTISKFERFRRSLTPSGIHRLVACTP